MQLRINLATRTYVNARMVTLVIAVAAALLTVIALWRTSTIGTASAEIEKMEKELVALEGKERRKLDENEYRKLLTKISFANSVILRKSYNWLTLFDRLENVVPEGVAITGIQPDPKTTEVKINGIARSFDGIRRFMENLEQSPDFIDVYLLGQAQAQVTETQQGTTFSITCKVNLK